MDAYATVLANGVFAVNWWNVHNGTGTVSTVARQTDVGLLSSAACLADGTTCEPALNTPSAPYHALAMTSAFARPGDQLVRASASDPLVKVHAARRADGDLTVLLINQDPTAAKPVRLRYAGYAPAAGAQVRTFANGDQGITTSTGSATALTIAPYSLTTLTLRPSAPVTGPTTPGRPTATTVTDSDRRSLNGRSHIG